MTESTENELRVDLYVEALLFAADTALNIETVGKVLQQSFDIKLKSKEIEQLIYQIQEKYHGEDFAIQLLPIANGYQFLTKPTYHKVIGEYLKLNSKKKLTRAAMETLSIIAYKQPISRAEIESIRGVSSDYSVQKLLEKELVEITGRAEGPGRPLLYGTTLKFLNHFGLKHAKDLPKLKELATTEDTIGVIDTKEEE
ncbi:MAG: SMC-Scp complex subunit ScpB [Bacteroidota bacterium]